MNDEVRSIYMTFPDEATALRVSSALLDERLIACANVFPAGRSVYRWQGKVEDEPEVVVIAKTTEGRVDALVSRVRSLHPYETPCVVALPAVGGLPEYLAWVGEETA